MNEMTPQQKQILQKAALQMAQYQHRDNPEVKKLREELDGMAREMEKQRRAMQKLQVDMQAKSRELTAFLMPLIAEELRD